MPTLGETIADRYQLLKELGAGGMGIVYLAKDRKVQSEVALKIVAAAGHSFQQLEARLGREARLSYRLGQLPGMVRALDWGVLEPKQSLYLVLDLVRDAKPLDLRKGSLTERLEWVARAAEIVQRLHERKVIHRDIKPDNFLVSGEGELFLSDFGIAKNVDEQDAPSGGMKTATGALLGTPMFMPMEQFESAASVGYAADVYSLGVMLFYALTGRFPFEGTNAVEVMSGQLEVRYKQRVAPRPSHLDAGVDPDLDRLCAFAIDIDVAKRPAQIPLFVRSLRLGIERLKDSSGSGVTTIRPDVEEAARSAAPPKPRRTRPRAAARLPRDEEGFASVEELKGLQEQLGPERFEGLLKGAPALMVEHERPLKGRADYQDRFAVVRSQRSNQPYAPVFVGRGTDASDIVLALPTISNPQIRLDPVANGGWEVSELGSRNGTTLNGVNLQADDPRPITDGDTLCLSKHVTFKFFSPSSLGEHLLWS